MPVSRRAFVVSVALQDSIIDFGEVFLLRNFPENSYNQAILYSRKCLLLTFIGYKISLQIFRTMGSIFSDRFENYYVSCNAHCDRRIIWVFPRNFKCVGMGGLLWKNN